MTLQHFFTVDVEEYFQVAALEPYIGRSAWPQMPSRLEPALATLLELLGHAGARGTFFTLGLVAEKQPALIRRIADAGHEIASHGWSHANVGALGPRAFSEEATRTRDLLEQVTGQRVTGFRAPNFSITPQCDWAFDVLVEAGYQYDSSVFPGRRGRRGAAPRVPYVMRRAGSELLEFAMTTVRVSGISVPAAGGAWFRLLPYALTERALRQAQDRTQPAVFYIHPWEVDPDQPRLAVDRLTRVRHYGGIAQTTTRLKRMVGEFSFTSIGAWLADRDGATARSAV